MRRHLNIGRYVRLLAIPAVFCAIPVYSQQAGTPAATDQPDNAALLQKIRDLEDRMVAMEGQIRLLKSQQATPPTATALGATQVGTPEAGAAGVPQTPPGSEPAPVSIARSGEATVQEPSLGGAGGSAAKALNPDISMIGDFIGSAGHNPVNPVSSFQMHESELGVQAIIDPYARGDFFLSFGESGVNLEEGYITLTALPAGLVAKVGKFRGAFGKINTMHNHVLPWVDRPLVSNNLVAGEDGIDDAGVSVQRILPADLGASYSRGYSAAGPNLLTHLYGVDATLRWKPLRRSIYHSFVGRTELIWSQRQQLPFEQRAFGFYTSGDYQLGRRWFVGGRYDRSGEAQNASLIDKGFSAVLTYWPSEFSQIRGQYEFTHYGNLDAHQLFMQVQFSLGAHGAHPF